ncbi:MAG TPA: dihydrolipoamide acetyltransferase family protein [Polyangia bacterium]
MAYEFKLPDIGEGVVEGEVVRWLVQVGDVITADQPMVEIMTDKATVEIPAPRAGKILERLFAEGEVCPVGKVLVRIEETGREAAPKAAKGPDKSAGDKADPARASLKAEMPQAPSGITPAVTLPTTNAATSSTSTSTSGDASQVLATPATRKLARTLGVDITSVSGSGPTGRVTSEDIRARAGEAPGSSQPSRAPSVAAGPDVRVPFRGVRRRIAEHLVKSRREAAHFTYVEEVDVTELVSLREKANGRRQGPKLSYLPFIIKATVEALRRFPQMNAMLDDAKSEIVQRRQYHIGLATATPDGLIVPVVRDADRKSINDLARDIERLAALTKSGKASRDDLSGSTFTLTSLGALGGVLATPILNHPEAGILGVHKISRRPVALGDKIVVRDMMNLSISVDHRLVDGYDAARFVADIKDSLESPGLLFLDAI